MSHALTTLSRRWACLLFSRRASCDFLAVVAIATPRVARSGRACTVPRPVMRMMPIRLPPEGQVDDEAKGDRTSANPATLIQTGCGGDRTRGIGNDDRAAVNPDR